MSGDPFQVHFHPKLGVVIYDPVAQMGLAREQMRLFKVGSMTSSTFMRGIVSKDLNPCEVSRPARARPRSSRIGLPAPAVASRTASRAARHYGSVDFTVCSDCSAHPLHLWHLQLRVQLASSQSCVILQQLR